MHSRRPLRHIWSWLAFLAVAALVASACGQKAGVHLAAGGGGGSGSNGDLSAGESGDATGTGEVGGGTGGGGAGGTSGGSSGVASGSRSGTSGASGTQSGTSGGSTAGGGAATGGAGGTSSGSTGPGNSTGVTDDTILIGIHAPATGAGAPQQSFDAGKDQYFQFIGKTINGRQIKVVFEDDGYNPGQAVAACKKLVQQNKVFLLVGGGGTDQIVACAQYANSVGVPYLAEGVTEAGVSKLQTYFAESMTYRAQGVLLAQYIKSIGKTKVAMVRGDTQNFEDAHTGFINAAKQQGLTVVADDAIAKDADAATASSEAQKICSSVPPTDIPNLVVYPLMSPKIFISFANAAASQRCFPRYAGIGITLGLNVVAQTVCPSGAFSNGATFFSPFPGLDKIDQMDPDFHKKYANGDDIGLALWGADKLLAFQLKAAGRNLTRESFIQSVLGKTFDTGVYPVADFTKSRFGGTATHVLKANCNTQQFETESIFKSGF
jgi:branched-chain amino acid transport system substrate-binding protein